MQYSYFSPKTKISKIKNDNKHFFSNSIDLKKPKVNINILLNRIKDNDKKENLRKLFLLGCSILLISIFTYFLFI
jgi:hypothetical protein